MIGSLVESNAVEPLKLSEQASVCSRRLASHQALAESPGWKEIAAPLLEAELQALSDSILGDETLAADAVMEKRQRLWALRGFVRRLAADRLECQRVVDEAMKHAARAKAAAALRAGEPPKVAVPVVGQVSVASLVAEAEQDFNPFKDKDNP